MHKKLSKVLILTFIFIFSFGISIVSAGGSREKTTVQEKEEQWMTIIDARGQEVKIKKPVERIATFPIPHPHIIVSIDGSAERIVGTHPMTKSAAKASILGKIAPNLLNAETGYLDGFKLNVEELLKVNPDVFFTDKVLEGMEKLEESGVPTIYLDLVQEEVSYRDGKDLTYSPKGTMASWIAITSAVLEKSEGKSTEIIKLWNDTENEINSKTANIPLGERPKVLIFFKVKQMMVASKGTFGHYWIASTCAINAAEELKSKHCAFLKLGSFEEILKWNPDIVYITNFDATMPEDILENKIPGQDWSGVTAVQEKRVYRIPLGIYRWYPPNLDGPIMLKWMAQKNYPELFNWDLRQEVKNHFIRFYNYNPTEQEIDAVLNPASTGTM